MLGKQPVGEVLLRDAPLPGLHKWLIQMSVDPAQEVDDDTGHGPTAKELRIAREAIAEIRGMARFLDGHQDEFARDHLNLFRSVEPPAR